jgi:hypothetical protein
VRAGTRLRIMTFCILFFAEIVNERKYQCPIKFLIVILLISIFQSNIELMLTSSSDLYIF